MNEKDFRYNIRVDVLFKEPTFITNDMIVYGLDNNIQLKNQHDVSVVFMNLFYEMEKFVNEKSEFTHFRDWDNNYSEFRIATPTIGYIMADTNDLEELKQILEKYLPEQDFIKKYNIVDFSDINPEDRIDDEVSVDLNILFKPEFILENKEFTVKTKIDQFLVKFELKLFETQYRIFEYEFQNGENKIILPFSIEEAEMENFESFMRKQLKDFDYVISEILVSERFNERNIKPLF